MSDWQRLPDGRLQHSTGLIVEHDDDRLKSADLRSKFGCIELLAVIRRLTNQGETT